MKILNHTIIVILLLLSLSAGYCRAQENKDDVIFKAMHDELSRSLNQMKLDKYNPPFYLAYRIFDSKMLTINASLGSLYSSNERDYNGPDARLMVGDYSLNDENFVPGSQRYSSGGTNLTLPKDLDYSGVRRSLWALSDRIYKSAVEGYEQKLTALKQQNKDESEKIDDYTKAAPVNKIMKDVQLKLDKARWENVAKELSAVFRGYDKISSSSVVVLFINSSVYFTSSEGTNIKFPVNFACISVNAFSQASDGEYLKDQLNYFAPVPEQLTSTEQIKSEIAKMAERLTSSCNIPPIEESYSGPVIFEGQAVAELTNQRLFGNNGLIAFREPVYAVENQNRGSVNKFDNKINQKICTEKITIRATPKLKTFQGTPLIGSVEIDAEGIVPADELVLVDKGILKTLLNDRVPTSKVKESNGHRLIDLNGGSGKAPSVIQISYENSGSLDSLKKATLSWAAENGMEYVYLIRKIHSFSLGISRWPYGSSSLPVSKPIEIYKLSTKTGEEQRVRSAVISDFPVTALKQIIGGTKEQFVYNTLRGATMVSYIVPKSIVINDLNIEKDKSTKPKLPVVPNPVQEQK